MGDLISREDAIDIMKAEGDVAQGTSRAVFYRAARMLELLPAMDAELVRHAWWKAANRRGTLCDTYICSECGNMVMQAEGYTYSCTCNYCPNCGAKMDGEEKNV